MSRRRRSTGQAIVEFAIVLPLLAMFILGIVDLGRGIYIYNGVSQAAREIARSASVHPGSPLGTSAETLAVIATQRTLVPGITNPIGFHCEFLDGGTVPGDGSGGCAAPNVVRVEVHVSYTPALILGIGSVDIASSSSNQVQ
jgi:hypothetical protein